MDTRKQTNKKKLTFQIEKRKGGRGVISELPGSHGEKKTLRPRQPWKRLEKLIFFCLIGRIPYPTELGH